MRCTSASILAGDALALADKPRFLARAASRLALAVPTDLATFCFAAAAFLPLALADADPPPPPLPALVLPAGVAVSCCVVVTRRVREDGGHQVSICCWEGKRLCGRRSRKRCVQLYVYSPPALL